MLRKPRAPIGPIAVVLLDRLCSGTRSEAEAFPNQVHVRPPSQNGVMSTPAEVFDQPPSPTCPMSRSRSRSSWPTIILARAPGLMRQGERLRDRGAQRPHGGRARQARGRVQDVHLLE